MKTEIVMFTIGSAISSNVLQMPMLKMFPLEHITLHSRRHGDRSETSQVKFRYLLLQSSWPKALVNPLFLAPGLRNHYRLGRLNKEKITPMLIQC